MNWTEMKSISHDHTEYLEEQKNRLNVSEGSCDFLPPYLAGEDLLDALAVLPPYDPNVRKASVGIRMAALADLYELYVPTTISVEIYNKLYFAIQSSTQKKRERLFLQQQYANHGTITGGKHRGIIGGSDSFSIIGSSGIGKSTGIGQAMHLMGGDTPVTLSHPYRRLIPALMAQTPFDCSPKGMLLQILLAADELLGTNYHSTAIRARATQDMLIGTVSQICLNHVGLLIVDEIQNVVENKNGRNLVGMLTQLINASGTSVCFVGTPEVGAFFEQTAYLARRTIGLHYGPMEYDEEFCHVCSTLLDYCYTARGISNREALVREAHGYSGGTISTVVSLLHDAQEIAILSGREVLDIRSLDEAWRKRMGTMHGGFRPQTGNKVIRPFRGKPAADAIFQFPGSMGGEVQELGRQEAEDTGSAALNEDGDMKTAAEDKICKAGREPEKMPEAICGMKSLLADISEQSEEDGTDLYAVLAENGLLLEQRVGS